ncbi:MAG: biotin/lipoyl-binding protein, partial [Firmicutes bacterium]|nr:biotin/lipoyl-binding protein [Bacillota bacterium]
MTRRRMMFLIAAVLVAVTVAVLARAYTRRDNQAGKTSSGAEAPKTYVVARGTLSASVDVSGTLQSTQKESLYSTYPAKVVELSVSPGVTVKRGDVLARLESDELLRALHDAEDSLEAARIKLEAAQRDSRTSPEQAKVQLEKARADYAAAKNRLDQLLAGPDAATLEQAMISLDQAIRARDTAADDLARYEALYAVHGVSRVDLENQRVKYRNAEDQVTTARSKVESLLAGPKEDELKSAEAQLKQAELNLAAAIENEKSAAASARDRELQVQIEVRRAEKALADVRDALESTVPSNGARSVSFSR